MLETGLVVGQMAQLCIETQWWNDDANNIVSEKFIN